MFNNPVAKDLSLLTAAKIAVIMAIYFALFAVHDGQPVNLASHLLSSHQGP